MKNSLLSFVLLFAFIFISFNTFGQNQEILVDTDEFDYLIGMEYSDVKELDDLEYKSRTIRVGIAKEISSTNFTKGNYQIITSESATYEPNTLKKIYKIQDVIVLNGYYSSCEGCLISGAKDSTIESIHQKGEVKEETVLIAFEKNNLTGIYTQVDPTKYKWSGNADRLEKLRKQSMLRKF